MAADVIEHAIQAAYALSLAYALTTVCCDDQQCWEEQDKPTSFVSFLLPQPPLTHQVLYHPRESSNIISSNAEYGTRLHWILLSTFSWQGLDLEG